MKLKPNTLIRFLFLLSLCVFGLSCRHDILVQPVDETAVSSSVNSATNRNDCSNPLTAVVVARRGHRQSNEYYQLVFTNNPKVQTIFFDRRNNFYFGLTIKTQFETIKQDCQCSSGSTKLNNIVVEIPQPRIIIAPRSIWGDAWRAFCGLFG